MSVRRISRLREDEGDTVPEDAPDNSSPMQPFGGNDHGSGGGSGGLGSGSKPRSRERGLIEGALKELGSANFAFTARPPSLSDNAIPGYEITREIHRGGQGVVYQAIQQSTQKKVAIKVMHGGAFASANDRARIEREVRILANLNHPNIVKVYDSGEVQGAYYYVMDYVSGHGLETYIKSGPHSIEQTLKLFATICEAVNAAHLKGVIHRDLKPSNIRIDPEGKPHILDFGLAKLVMDETGPGRDMTLTGQFIGSLFWASPEQAGGAPGSIDIRTDVYSLGVILYQMLTVGKFPYNVLGNMRDVLDNILRAEPARPSTVRRQVNDEVETIVLKCLQKERERRYQSAGDLGRDVLRYLTGEPIEAKRDSGLYVISKSLRKHKALVGAAGVVAAVCLASGVVFSVLYAREGVLRHQAEEAKAAETLQRERAERNAKEVRALALTFMLDFADSMENLRGATKVRENVLRTAKDSLVKLAAEPGAAEDLGLQKELADAWARVGEIEGGLYLPRVGTVAASQMSFGEARRIRELIVQRKPGDASSLGALAASRRQSGQGMQRQRKFDEAATEFESGIADIDRAMKLNPDAALTQTLTERKLALRTDLADLGKVRAAELRDAEKSVQMADAAMRVYEDVEAYWKARLAAHGDDEKAARSAGVVTDKKSQTLIALGRSLMAAMVPAIDAGKTQDAQKLAAQARGAFERAHQLAEAAAAEFEKMVAAQPANRQARRDQYLAIYNCGDANMRLGELAEALTEKKLAIDGFADASTYNERALAKFKNALEITDRLASSDDSNLEAMHDVGLCLNKVGNLLRSLHRLDDAAVIFERSLLLREDLYKTDVTDQHLKDLAVGQYKRAEVLELSADRADLDTSRRTANLSRSVALYEAAAATYRKQSDAKLEVRAADVKQVREAADRAAEKLKKLRSS